MLFYRKKLKKNINVKGSSIDILDKRTSMWKPLFLILPALIVIVLFVIIPFITAANDGFHYENKSLHTHRESAKIFGTDNFRRLFQNKEFKSAISNSMLYALISIPIILLLSLIISSAISTLIRKRLRGFWQTIFFLPYVTSAIAIGLTFAYIFDYDRGLMNKAFGIKVPWLIDTKGHSALWAMLIYGVWKGLAFNILIFTTAMLSIDKKLYKASSIDGAGPIRQFFTITLPSIKSTLSFLFTMGLISAIKVFPLALFSNKPEIAGRYNGSTILLYIYEKISVDHNYAMAGAASLVLVGISIGFTIVVRTSTKLIGKSIGKEGERYVQAKIKASEKNKQKKTY